MGLKIRINSRLTLTQFFAMMVAVGIFYSVIKYFTEYTVFADNGYYYYNTNLLGWSLFYTGIIAGLLVFMFSDVKLFLTKSLNSLSLLLFIVSVWLFANESKPINLFILYELFLLPSFILVYRLSPNRRSIIASIYFLTWTQFGSLLVLVAIVGLFFFNGNVALEATEISQHSNLYWLLFLGFGIKIPMWPFYYWLTKTHVEASSFFSMYLSGFLVKTAVFLFIKFYGIIGNTGAEFLLLTLFIIGVVDASIKMWHQTDLKKLVAYTTVQEMNFLCIPILWNDFTGEALVSLFIATHCLLSCIFFFFIDVISKRFNTRVSSQITGLVHTMPYFTFLIFLSWILFAGLPFTIKFLLEVGIFSMLYVHNFMVASSILLIMNVVGLIGFTKNLFNAVFGAPVISDYIIYDLTAREITLLIFLLTNLVALNFFSLAVF